MLLYRGYIEFTVLKRTGEAEDEKAEVTVDMFPRKAARAKALRNTHEYHYPAALAKCVLFGKGLSGSSSNHGVAYCFLLIFIE